MSCSREASDPQAWFGRMVQNCLDYAQAGKAAGRPVVGILCEYAPRELILAAGGIPVCLCGGDADLIPAAEAHLPANLCPLIKSTYGYHLRKQNPLLEMADLVVAETTCDGKKKMFELLAETRPTHLLELPQKENDDDALEHWTRELRLFKAALESRFQVAITDDRIRSAIAVMNRERALRRALAELMKVEQPPLTGRQLLGFKSLISGIPADHEQYEAVLQLFVGRLAREPHAASCLGGQRAEVRSQKSEVGSGESEARGLRPVRVLLTGVPLVHGAERVMDIIETHGGLVVCQENCTGLKPILEDVDIKAPDPLRALAEKYYRLPCSVKTRNGARQTLLRRLAGEYRAECVIELIWQACHTYAIESFQIRRLAEEELDLPYLRIETDYSPSDSARIAVRVEALFEMVRSRGCS